MPSSEDEDYYSESEEEASDQELEDLSRKIFGKNQNGHGERRKILYCPVCAGKHPHEDCKQKK